MRILLTGATGQVGGALLPLLQAGADVLAPSRLKFDLSQPDTLAEFLDRTKPDLIINPAAYTAVDHAEDEQDLAYRINAHAPGAIATWAARHDVPLIHFSTDYVFNGGGDRPWREDDLCAPLSVYGKSKRAGELQIAATRAAHLIIRTSWVYAAEGKNFLRTIVRLVGERPELRVVADQIGAPTSAISIARIVSRVAMMEVAAMRTSFAEADGLIHLTNAGATSWHGFASAILHGLQARAIETRANSIVPIESKDFPTKAVRPSNSRLDLGRLDRIFGVTAPAWQDALSDELDLLVTREGLKPS